MLTERVANQIAAGEVVERPASVCKELIENALDAGATRITIELRGGGRSLIRVGDNGCGMNRDDALLAFERHATSKLRSADDLLAIATLGFRGEALPSIASVSRLTLRTRAADEEAGTVVEIHGGRLRDVRDGAPAEGTSVAVRNLFFNVPARRKFLRTERTELRHVVRVATHYSLAHLDKTIQLRSGGGTPLSVTPVASLRERVYQVFGGDALRRLVELEKVRERSLGLEGFVSEPQSQRSSRDSIYVFVNRRLVRDALIQKAIARGYENLMPKGVYPFALLFLELPAGDVDVNVHPAKTEVRFRNPGQVFEFVRSSIRARLVADKPASELPGVAPAPGGGPPGTASQGVAPAGGTRTRPPPVGLPPSGPSRLEFTGWTAVGPRPARSPAAAVAAGDGAQSGREAAVGVRIDDALHSRAPLVEQRPANLAKLGRLEPLGQYLNSFIVASGEDGVWIVDQHVAHERILFEQVLEARLRGRPPMQRLVAPIVRDADAGADGRLRAARRGVSRQRLRDRAVR